MKKKGIECRVPSLGIDWLGVPFVCAFGLFGDGRGDREGVSARVMREGVDCERGLGRCLRWWIRHSTMQMFSQPDDREIGTRQVGSNPTL